MTAARLFASNVVTAQLLRILTTSTQHGTSTTPKTFSGSWSPSAPKLEPFGAKAGALRRQRRPWEPNLPRKERRQSHRGSNGHRCRHGVLSVALKRPPALAVLRALLTDPARAQPELLGYLARPAPERQPAGNLLVTA